MISRFVRAVTIYAAFTCLGLISFAHADELDAAIVLKLNSTFESWLVENRLSQGSLAAIKDDQLVDSYGYGGRLSSQPVPMASLSKAITAACVGRLVDEGRLSFSANLGTVLAKIFDKFGTSADKRFKSITIEQLLTHTSGLHREVETPFLTKPQPGRERLPPPNSLEGMFKWVLTDDLGADPGAPYLYSNIGYLTLGMVIEAISGENYEAYCRRSVLMPMGISNATIERDLRGRAPSGGWVLSAEDYARFLQGFRPNSPIIGPMTWAWIEEHEGTRFYALGTFVRRVDAERRVYWHSGKIADRTIAGGSYFLKMENGWTVVVNFSPYAPDGSTSDLDRRLYHAAHGR